jgi:CTD small phosphatase-like protein 2
MQTRKKSAARYAAGDHANPKTSRPSRKATQFAAAEKKVTDLITSSSKKQRPGKFHCSCGNVHMHMQKS